MAKPSPHPTSPAAGAVLTFLESIGRRNEAELYLELFSQLPKQSFALVVISEGVLKLGIQSLVEQLGFLHELGLSTPLVTGLSSSVAPEHLDALGRRLRERGLGPVLPAGDPGRSHHEIAAALCDGQTPIIDLGGLGAAAEASQRWLALGGLASALGTRKLVLVRRRGGIAVNSARRRRLARQAWLPLEGSLLSQLTLSDLPLLREICSKTDIKLIQDLGDLLLRAELERTSISITSPLDLLRELFTVRGAGTLVRQGAHIVRRTSDEVDGPRLAQLLERSFGLKLLRPPLSQGAVTVFLERDYRGAALVRGASDFAYLSKFAVEPVARGEGLGRDLWQAMVREFSKLVWRTRRDNPTAQWYLTVCDGMVRVGPWQVFWRGLEPDQLGAAVSYACAEPDDFARTESAPD